MYINKELSGEILIIGPGYHNHRGGIGTVIDIYSNTHYNSNIPKTFKTE